MNRSSSLILSVVASLTMMVGGCFSSSSHSSSVQEIKNSSQWSYVAEACKSRIIETSNNALCVAYDESDEGKKCKDTADIYSALITTELNKGGNQLAQFVYEVLSIQNPNTGEVQPAACWSLRISVPANENGGYTVQTDILVR
jgi:hypothetical protein